MRAEALDLITFIEAVIETTNTDALPLVQEVRSLKTELKEANSALYTEIRVAIQDGLRGQALRERLSQFTDFAQNTDRPYFDYDGLDVLWHGVLKSAQPPDRTTELEAGMVHCEHTPTRAILELTQLIQWQPDDYFYDLGSGMGQVPILVHLLTGVPVRGVEFEPAYCRAAHNSAQTLGLSQVTFINEDARTADYRAGTHFFMFTPFKGEMLQAVLARLAEEAAQRPITILTFGSCTPQVAQAPWLQLTDPTANHEYRLAIFHILSWED